MLADLAHLDVEDRQSVFDQRNVEVFLGAEVQVDRADGELSCASDELDRSTSISALRKHRASRLLDATAARLSLLRLAFLSVRHGAALVILTQAVKHHLHHH